MNTIEGWKRQAGSWFRGRPLPRIWLDKCNDELGVDLHNSNVQCRVSTSSAAWLLQLGGPKEQGIAFPHRPPWLPPAYPGWSCCPHSLRRMAWPSLTFRRTRVSTAGAHCPPPNLPLSHSRFCSLPLLACVNSSSRCCHLRRYLRPPSHPFCFISSFTVFSRPDFSHNLRRWEKRPSNFASTRTFSPLSLPFCRAQQLNLPIAAESDTPTRDRKTISKPNEGPQHIHSLSCPTQNNERDNCDRVDSPLAIDIWQSRLSNCDHRTRCISSQNPID